MKKSGNHLVRAHIIIEGQVQGVFFRASTIRVSRENKITGWVRNRPGGTVEAVLEGDKSHVEKVIKWCRSGPPMARVDGIELTWEDYEGEFPDFSAK
ncbi:MAG: acylphosphatase [Thermodesulfobacteriota bacterium]